MVSPKFDGKHWFVLNFINKAGSPTPKRHIDRFNQEGHALELFAPIFRPARVENGAVKHSERLLTFFYVFVRGEFEEVKALCLRPDNGLSLLLDRGSARRYAVVSDSDMENFKIIARAHSNTIPFYRLEDIDLAEGDLVEVVGGAYDGLKGTFLPKRRSGKGNLVISASSSVGTILWDVSASAVRVLKFARDVRRPYDQLDAFVPKLFRVLRKFHSGEELGDKDKAVLMVFSQRMGSVSLDSSKCEVKLLSVLACVHFLLGDASSLACAQSRLERRRGSLTNAWTIAMCELLSSVVASDVARLSAAYASVRGLAAHPTRAQRELLEEFRHYLSL